jgi:ABC-type transport system involved in multi-copper enzyme maturation permease subunit
MTTPHAPTTPSTAAPDLRHLDARTPGGDARAVAGALKSEWIKAVTVRATGAVGALALGGGLVVSWAVSTFVTDRVQYVADVGFLWTGVTAMLAAIAGVLLFGSEVQHGTLASTLTARPARWIIVLAKALVAGTVGLALGVAGLVAGFGGAAIAGLDAGDTSSVASTIGWALLFTTLSAVLGLGLAMVVRNSTAAIGGLLVWGFVVENLLQLFLAEQIARFLPFAAGNHLLTDTSGFASPDAVAVALTRPENAVVFGGYTAVALVVGTVLLYRRDTN